jgi:hypothetical protein
MKTPNLTQALTAIEDLVGDDFAEEIMMEHANGRLRGRSKEMAWRLRKIYRIAHGFNRKHSCYHVHGEWRKIPERVEP